MTSGWRRVTGDVGSARWGPYRDARYPRIFVARLCVPFFKACDMVNPGAVESNFQYVSMWKVLSGDRPGVDLVDRPGISVCWADSAFPFWNALFLTDRIGNARDLSARLREGAGYMRAKRQAGLVYVCQDFLNPGVRGR